MKPNKAVSADKYTEDYYLESCGGAEFFDRYGPEIPKPTLAYALKKAELKPGMEILDIGCGRGEILFQAGKIGAGAVGTDYAEAALRLAKTVSGAPVLLCDAKALPFKDGIFDLIFFIGVIDHLHDWELEICFAEMKRLLKPGGRVLVHTCTNRHYYKTLTYRLRKALAAVAASLGAPLRAPRPPRSSEDEQLHVNEHSYGHLRSFFQNIGWEAEIEALPNHKDLVERLYGPKLPPDFPMKAASLWKRVLNGLLFKTPLKRVLAREYFIAAAPF